MTPNWYFTAGAFVLGLLVRGFIASADERDARRRVSTAVDLVSALQAENARMIKFIQSASDRELPE